MFHAFFQTSGDRTLTLVRVTLGTVMLAHGLQKVFGWFGGYGFEGTMGFLTQALGVPAPVAALVIVGEVLAGLGLIGGLLTRASAAGTIAIMLGAVAMVHWPNGFFMNWSGQQGGEGYEFHLLALAMAVAVAVKGAGAFSFDRVISERLETATIPVEPKMREREAAVAR